MKVILTQDVKGQGKRDELIEVSDGYAKNFLLKNGYAIEASKSSINTLMQKKSSLEHRREVERAEALELSKKLSEMTIKISLKVSEKGKIFGALTSATIAEELLKLGIEIDKRKIVLPEPIKMVGRYTVAVKLFPEVNGKMTIDVEGI